jgi:hypothetical protein
MAKGKSILDKITDTMKGIAGAANDAATNALKAAEAGAKAGERTATYVPLAADGLVSDPMMMPVAVAPPRKRRPAPKRAAKAQKAAVKRSPKKGKKKTARKQSASTVKKSARKTKKIATKKRARKTRRQ